MKAFQASILFSSALLLCACQSNSFKVNGSAEALADGDTLFVTTDMESGTPSDTILVKDGKFQYAGETDSLQLCMIYSAARNEINAPFFLEAGNISVTLSETPGASRVGGTQANNEWQRLNDSVMVIGKEINRIAEHIYGNTVSQEEQQRGMGKIEQLNKRFAGVVADAIKRNIDNEFGYFLLTYYPEDVIDDNMRSNLIKQLPDAMRQRPAIKLMQKHLEAAANTSEGAVITDFTQPSLDGTPLSIMDEIRRNKITVIDFWASWCGPCRQEMPMMTAMYDKYKDKGLGIVGISLDNDGDAWQQATQQLGIKWPQMSDLKGWDNAAAQLFNISSIPHTVVIDQNGKILRRGLRGTQLEQFVDSQLQ